MHRDADTSTSPLDTNSSEHSSRAIIPSGMLEGSVVADLSELVIWRSRSDIPGLARSPAGNPPCDSLDNPKQCGVCVGKVDVVVVQLVRCPYSPFLCSLPGPCPYSGDHVRPTLSERALWTSKNASLTPHQAPCANAPWI